MRHPLLTQRRVLFLAVIPLLLVGSFLPPAIARVTSDKPRDLVRMLHTPVTQALKRVGDSIRSPDDLKVDLGPEREMEQNYRELLRYARQLEDDLRRSQAMVANLTQMRQGLGMRATRLLPAVVTAPPTGPASPTLTIDRGTREGIAPGQVVAAADGFNLAGLITDAGPLTASVQLITKPGTRLDVRILPPTPGASPREVFTQLQLNDKGQFEAVLGADRPVNKGDLAHLSDDHWPAEARGFVVGTVIAVQSLPQDPLVYRRVIVQPVRSLAHLKDVIVLVPAPVVGTKNSGNSASGGSGKEPR